MSSKIISISHLKIAIAAFLTVVFGAVFTGCGDSAQTKEEIRREKNSYKDTDVAAEKAPELHEKLDLEKAKSFALEHNLQNVIRNREREIKKELSDLAWYKMLPTMTLDFNKNRRNQTSASRSENIETGQESLTNSYSSETSSKTYNLKTAWNILDFGVSYLMARQDEFRERISELEYKRAVQNLTLDVTRSYWRNLANSSAAIDAREILEMATDRNNRIERLLKENIIPREDGLNINKEMLATIKRLKGYRNEVVKARTEFASLLGVSPRTDIKFSDTEVPYIADYEKFDVKKLEEAALFNRPELFQEDYEERVSTHNVYIAALKLLPSPSLVLEHNWDDNPHLHANYWYVLGAKAAYEMLQFPSKLSARRQAKLEAELVRQRRMAVAVGILAQVRLSLIRYHSAAKKCVASSEIAKVQNELVDVTALQIKQGKARSTDLVTARTEAFFAKVDYLLAYAEMMTMKEQLLNSIGYASIQKDPELEEIKPFYQKEDDIVVANSVSLKDIAKQLEYTDFKVAMKAKVALLQAGTDGAAAALDVLNSSDQRARLIAILVVRENGTPKMIASLLPALEDDNPNIRYQASLALRNAFGKDFGYYHEASAEERSKAAMKWREYLFGQSN